MRQRRRASVAGLLAWAGLAALAAPAPARAQPELSAAGVARVLAEIEQQAQGEGVKVAELRRQTAEVARLQAEATEQVAALEPRLEALLRGAGEPPAEDAGRAARAAEQQAVAEVLRGWRDNVDRAGRLAAQLQERLTQAQYRERLAAIEDSGLRRDPDMGELEELIREVTRLRAELAQRIAGLEQQRSQTQDSLALLLGGDATAEDAEQPSSESPGDAVPPVSDEVAAEVTRLRGRVGTVNRWLGEYRLILLRAETLLSDLQRRVRDKAAAELLEHGPSVVSLADATLADPELWPEFGRRLMERSALGLLARQPWLAGLGLLLVTVGALLGRWLRGRLIAVAQLRTTGSFGARLWCALLASAARHAPWLLALGGAAVAGNLLSTLSDSTPFIALVLYALLLFIVLRTGARALLAPFPPAASLVPFPAPLERSLARRLGILMLLAVTAYLLREALTEYRLPDEPFLLVRVAYVAMLAINLAWLLWLLGRLPVLARFGPSARAVALGLVTLALAAELLGYRNLSAYLLRGVVGTLVLLPSLWVVQHLLAELFELLDGEAWRWVRWLRARAGAEAGAPLPGMGWLRFLAGLLLWTGVLLALLRIWASEAGYASALAFLNQGVQFGELTIAPAKVFAGLVVLSVLVVGVGWGAALLQQAMRANPRLDQGARDATATLASYAGYTLAVLTALNTIGIDFTKLAVVAGALSVGIGFGLQNIVNNFVSGLILLFEREIKAGDRIRVGDVDGTVRRVSVRYTEVRTGSGVDVIVPNSDLLSKSVANQTHADPAGQLEIPVVVPYGTDLQRVTQLLLGPAEAHPEVLQAGQPPRVLLREFGARGLGLELWCQVRQADRAPLVQSDLAFAIEQGLREAGIAPLAIQGS